MRIARFDAVSIFVLAIALVIAFQAQHQWKARDTAGHSVFAVRDFQAFYCAGATRNAGGDPYLAADFLACGGRPPGRAPMRDELDSPAPFPGYDVALFALVAKLPYVPAAYVWLALSTIAIFGGAFFLARATNLPPFLIAASFSVIAVTALFWGQLAPISLGALCLGAFAAERQRGWLVAVASIVAAIEPHIGLPVLLATFVYLPRSRAAIGAGIFVLLVASLVGASVRENIEYFTKTTPLQIGAEVSMDNQYSLTWLLYAFGVPSKIAATAGSLSYLATVALGVWLARPIARVTGSDAAIVLVPVACAVIGGPFIHSNQVVLALPAILLIVGRVKRSEPVLWIAAAVLAVRWADPEWLVHTYTPIRLECLALVGVIAFFAAHRLAPRRAIAVSVTSVVAYLAITFSIMHVSAEPWNRAQSAESYARQIGSDVAYASGRYGLALREVGQEHLLISWQAIAGKVPYWLALIAFVACAGALAAPRRRQTVPVLLDER